MMREVNQIKPPSGLWGMSLFCFLRTQGRACFLSSVKAAISALPSGCSGGNSSVTRKSGMLLGFTQTPMPVALFRLR